MKLFFSFRYRFLTEHVVYSTKISFLYHVCEKSIRRQMVTILVTISFIQKKKVVIMENPGITARIPDMMQENL